MQKRIAILNDGLGPNKGDQAILASMLNALRKSIPGIEISVLPYYWKVKELFRMLQALSASNMLILGGGQVLHDQTSVSFNLLVLSKVVLAMILRKRILCYAIGVGPLKTKIGKFFTKSLINRVEVITVRDSKSKQLLENLGVNKPPIYVTADASVNLTPTSLERVKDIFAQEGIVKENRLLVAIAPRRWFLYNHSLIPIKYRARFNSSFVKSKAKFREFENLIARVGDYLVTKLGAHIVFVPMRCGYGSFDPGQDDDKVSSEIVELMQCKDRANVIGRDYTPRELKGILGQMDVVVSMRMHAIIMASTMCVPVVGISISPKFGPFFEMIGQNAYLIDINDSTFGALSDTIQSALTNKEQIKEELIAKTRFLQTRALKNIDFVSSLLGEL